MDTHTDRPRTQDLQVLVDRGREIERFLSSGAVATAIAMTRARIYDDWTGGVGAAIREATHAEYRALDRLLESFQGIQRDGEFAQEAIRQREQEDDEELASEAIV